MRCCLTTHSITESQGFPNPNRTNSTCQSSPKVQFPMEKAKTRNGGANISVSTIEAIKALSAQGMKPEEIAKKLNVSTWTVYRRRK